MFKEQLTKLVGYGRWMKRGLSAASREKVYRAYLKHKNISRPSDRVGVCYGDHIGNVRGIAQQGIGEVTGGQVKLGYLQERFPHEPEKFNVLYLVSSALPPFPIMLSRWAKSNGVKVVLNQNGVAYSAWTPDHEAINAELRELFALADFIVYQSEFCKQAADRYVDKPQCPWKILFNCVDLERFKPDPLNVRNDVTRLLVAGTHYQAERVTHPIQVVHELRKSGINATLDIAGRLRWENAKTEVATLIEQLELGASVRISGPYSQVSAPLIFARADILMHLKYKDPCPNVAIEALASGVPVIGTMSGGLPELVGVSAGAGMLLDVADDWDQMHYAAAGDLSQAVEQIVNMYNEYTESARKRAELLFSADHWIAEHELFIDDLLS